MEEMRSQNAPWGVNAHAVIGVTLFVLVVITLISCDAKKSRLALLVAAADEECPQAFEGGVMTGVAMDDGDVVFTMEMDADVMLGINILHSTNTLKDILKYSLAKMSSDDEDLKELFDILSEADAGMRLVIRGRGSDTDVTVRLSHDDVVDVVEGNVSFLNGLLDTLYDDASPSAGDADWDYDR